MKYIFTIISLIFCLEARADISWMKGAVDCKSYAPALDAYLDKVDLSKYSIFPFWQKEELAIALREACSGKFSECNLEACKKWGTLASFSAPKEGGNSSLFWLNRFLTCEQLMEQIKSRYANMSQDQLSDENKKKEFRLVLSAACSDRFSHCSFASCEEYNHDKKIDRLIDLAPKENKNERIVQNYEVLRANMIKLALEQESANGLVWRRFSNPDEAQVVARRREESRRRKAEQGGEGQENYEASSSSPFRRSYFSSQGSSRSSARPRRNYSSSARAKGILPF